MLALYQVREEEAAEARQAASKPKGRGGDVRAVSEALWGHAQALAARKAGR